MDRIDLSDYIESNIWELMEYPAKKNDKYYPCCPEPYPDMTYTLRLKRRGTYYQYVFVCPAVMLALLTPVLFLLPSDDTGKFPLGKCSLVGPGYDVRGKEVMPQVLQ